MAIFIPHKDIESDLNFGRVINKARKKYIEPEVKKRGVFGFATAGIEIFSNKTYKVYLDDEVQVSLEFKKRKIRPSDTGKPIDVNLEEIKHIQWHDKKLSKNSVKILVVHFNKNWWIWDADFKNRKDIEEQFKVTRTFKIRGGGYMPLSIRLQQKSQFMQDWQTGLKKEMPAMWVRHITVSQKYRGVMVYDGNYFDLFSHAQELYVLGHYYSSIVICRIAAEQALIRILIKEGMEFEIYRSHKKGARREIKGIKELVKSCRDSNIFSNKKYPINKTAEKKLMDISYIASDLIHPKSDLDEVDVYKKEAVKCMDNLQYVIKHHLDFIKDTGVVSGYRISGSANRLR